MTAQTLIIAGSEATGGAGLQADIRAMQSMDVIGVGALTCIVAFDPQNNWTHRFHPVAPHIIEQQIEAALACRDLDVVKIGMLGTVATIEAVRRSLETQQWRHIVLDPVLICKGQEPGAALDTDTALRQQLLPSSTVITPNKFEAEMLAGMSSLETVADLEEAAKRIHELGPRYVVVKSGMDFPGDEVVDVLFDGETTTIYKKPKIGSERISGAGCSFASAIAAGLTKGYDIHRALEEAEDLVLAMIKNAVSGAAPFKSVGLAHSF